MTHTLDREFGLFCGISGIIGLLAGVIVGHAIDPAFYIGGDVGIGITVLILVTVLMYLICSIMNAQGDTKKILSGHIPDDEEQRKKQLNKEMEVENVRVALLFKEQLKDTLSQIQGGFTTTYWMYIFTFALGFILIGYGLYKGISPQDPSGAVISGLGVADILSFLVFNPPKRIQNSRMNYAQLMAPYYAWFVETANRHEILDDYREEMKRLRKKRWWPPAKVIAAREAADLAAKVRNTADEEAARKEKAAREAAQGPAHAKETAEAAAREAHTYAVAARETDYLATAARDAADKAAEVKKAADQAADDREAAAKAAADLAVEAEKTAATAAVEGTDAKAAENAANAKKAADEAASRAAKFKEDAEHKAKDEEAADQAAALKEAAAITAAAITAAVKAAALKAAAAREAGQTAPRAVDEPTVLHVMECLKNPDKMNEFVKMLQAYGAITRGVPREQFIPARDQPILFLPSSDPDYHEQRLIWSDIFTVESGHSRLLLQDTEEFLKMVQKYCTPEKTVTDQTGEKTGIQDGKKVTTQTSGGAGPQKEEKGTSQRSGGTGT